MAILVLNGALLLAGTAFTDDLDHSVSVEGRFHRLNLFRFSHLNQPTVKKSGLTCFRPILTFQPDSRILPAMKTPLQVGPNGRVSVPSEKQLLIS